jgi:hypothetical protein
MVVEQNWYWYFYLVIEGLGTKVHTENFEIRGP